MLPFNGPAHTGANAEAQSCAAIWFELSDADCERSEWALTVGHAVQGSEHCLVETFSPQILGCDRRILDYVVEDSHMDLRGGRTEDKDC